jgi:hypothetical protein
LPLDDQQAVELEKRLHLSFGGYVGRMGIAKCSLNRRDAATPVQAGAWAAQSPEGAERYRTGRVVGRPMEARVLRT